jgi:hypothetical protein
MTRRKIPAWTIGLVCLSALACCSGATRVPNAADRAAACPDVAPPSAVAASDGAAPPAIAVPPVAVEPQAGEAGAWSSAVAGIRARLIVSAGEVYEGTALPRVDIELQNVSDVGNPLELYWDVDAVLRFQLADDAGADIPTSPLPVDIMRPTPYWVVLPWDSTVRINITTSGYGIRGAQRMLLGLPGDGAWEIAAGDARRLFLRGTLTAAQVDDAGRRAWRGTIELPPVEVR